MSVAGLQPAPFMVFLSPGAARGYVLSGFQPAISQKMLSPY